MKGGFLIGGALVVAGLLLQLSLGPVRWEAFAWPVNGILMAVFLSMIALSFLLSKRARAFQFIGTLQAAIPAMAYAVVLTIIMGLTRQEAGADWWNDMTSFWPFVLIYVYIAVILGFVSMLRLVRFVNGTASRRRWHDVSFLLNHLGLFIAMTTATLGNADMQRLQMVTTTGEPESRALTQQNTVKALPLTIELKKFILETYDDGSPRRFASEIQIQTQTGKTIETIVEVNKPCEVEGWRIYQYAYDTRAGAASRTSVLQLVHDPWLPLVYTGIYMMLAGAVCLFATGRRKRT